MGLRVNNRGAARDNRSTPASQDPDRDPGRDLSTSPQLGEDGCGRLSSHFRLRSEVKLRHISSAAAATTPGRPAKPERACWGGGAGGEEKLLSALRNSCVTQT